MVVRAGENFEITVHGYEPHEGEFELTLHDCHVRDELGAFKYRKVRGKELPIYEIPKGLGLIERHQGDKTWRGWGWVKPYVVSNMLALLPNVRPLYIAIHEMKVERNRWMIGLTLQTTDPADE